MGKLHELLAVEGDLEGTVEKVVHEAEITFTKKPDHFLGHTKTLKMVDDSRSHEEESAAEHKEIVTTVDKKLDYVLGHLVKYYDAVLQKEATNQVAKADLVVDGEVLAEGLPATFLLGLESKLKKLRATYELIPTLAPGVRWEVDPTGADGVFRIATPELRKKEEKTIAHKVLYEATEHHPAQIEKWTENRVVGTFYTERTSGMITTAKKSALLGNIDKLLRAVKKARQRANATEVANVKVAEKLFDFINKV